MQQGRRFLSNLIILFFFFFLEIYVERLAQMLPDGHKFTEPPSSSRLGRWRSSLCFLGFRNSYKKKRKVEFIHPLCP